MQKTSILFVLLKVVTYGYRWLHWRTGNYTDILWLASIYLPEEMFLLVRQSLNVLKYLSWQNGGSVVFALLPKGPGFISANLFICGVIFFFFAWSLHVRFMMAWFSSGCSSFLTQSKDMQVRSTGNSKLPVGVNVFVSLYVY